MSLPQALAVLVMLQWSLMAGLGWIAGIIKGAVYNGSGE